MAISSVIIRRASSADAALLAELGAHTFSETFAAGNTAENLSSYLASAFSPSMQMKELADPRAVFFLAETEGNAAGYAKMQRGAVPKCVSSQSAAEIVRLYVKSKYHGGGVGAALIQECIEHGRRLGLERLWLGVWEHNPRAQAFYRKWGFREIGSHEFRMGSDAQTDLLMEYALYVVTEMAVTAEQRLPNLHPIIHIEPFEDEQAHQRERHSQ